MKVDLTNWFKLVQIERITKDADFDGANIDCLGSNGTTVVVDVGDVTNALVADTDEWNLRLQSAPDSDGSPGTWANVAQKYMVRDITAATTTGIFATIDTDSTAAAALGEEQRQYRVSYLGSDRWLRVVYDETGNCGNTPFATFALHQTHDVAPTV